MKRGSMLNSYILFLFSYNLLNQLIQIFRQIQNFYFAESNVFWFPRIILESLMAEAYLVIVCVIN